MESKIDIAINILSDKTCFNCEHFLYDYDDNRYCNFNNLNEYFTCNEWEEEMPKQILTQKEIEEILKAISE